MNDFVAWELRERCEAQCLEIALVANINDEAIKRLAPSLEKLPSAFLPS